MTRVQSVHTLDITRGRKGRGKSRFTILLKACALVTRIQDANEKAVCILRLYSTARRTSADSTATKQKGTRGQTLSKKTEQRSKEKYIRW